MFYDASPSSSLQIMRQIMAGKGCEESSVMELLKEAEEMKQPGKKLEVLQQQPPE